MLARGGGRMHVASDSAHFCDHGRRRLRSEFPESFGDFQRQFLRIEIPIIRPRGIRFCNEAFNTTPQLTHMAK